MRCEVNLAKRSLSNEPSQGIVADGLEILTRELAAKFESCD